MFMLRTLPCLVAGSLTALAATGSATTPATFRQYCFSCHGKAGAAAGLNLEQLTSTTPGGDQFLLWEKVAAALENKRMPPPKLPQPGDPERAQAASWIRASLKDYAAKHAGDPGKVTVRRLTSGEYGYTIQDLTGLQMKFDKDFVSDSVGGEGFTNFGDVQFMQDANLERYLQTAKQIADHAVIGAGPIQFYADPGKSGFELSAVARIQEIYTKNGFRANSGEGGKPYGVDRYGKAILTCWKYKHRAELGQPNATLKDLAIRDGNSVRFVEHLWTVLNDKQATYPTSEVVARWNKFPNGVDIKAAQVASTELQQYIVNWPRFLFGAGAPAEGGQGDERALIISEDEIQVKAKQKLRFNIIYRGREKLKTMRVYLSTVSVNPGAKDKGVVIWRNATLRTRSRDKAFSEPVSLVSNLTEENAKRLNFGQGAGVQPTDFVTTGDVSTYFDINMPEAGGVFELQVEAEAGPGDAIMRCVLADKEDISKGRPMSVLVGNPSLPSYPAWKQNLLTFAANLPSISQGEPTPADKDAIPAPYDNTYNQPERDSFHVKVKYYRTDRFIYEKILDDATRAKLDHAWNDLLASFEYHDAFLDFVVAKYKLDLKGKKIADLDMAFINSLPAEPRKYVAALKTEFNSVRDAEHSAEPGHVKDCLEFASKAWRRPLSATEKQSLEAFYKKSREVGKLDHERAIRALLTRILVSPAFLYRLEPAVALKNVANTGTAAKPLSSWELASRLSYFLWSSIPDEELRRAAAANELADNAKLEKQVKRMLADPKARRFSNEFFGQWFGFYRFDQFTGVDSGRFPEFNDEIKAAMYDEAVSFFEYIVRENRPVGEILSANYTFVNKPLAKHYGLKQEVKAAPGSVEKVDNAEGRGGVLRLGAVLAGTSAPLRTSPVKRGDWLLRRVLGTPTPPPPADAGSLPADEKAFGGLSLREKLAAHQRNATCAGCHSRIDPMGFPLEKYDPVGRLRETYSDGRPVLDTSTTADKQDIKGVDGLIQYLKNHEEEVLGTMSRKVIGYALGRTILASDQPLVDKMVKAGSNATVANLVMDVVTSKQFRYRREDDTTVTSNPAVAVLRPQEKGLSVK
jgi:hypothetical protein